MYDRPIISIIIVHYKVEKQLRDCIDSIAKSKPTISFEIIVVDNDETQKIKKKLKKDFPRVRYFKSKENKGFGSGNNLGAKYARGEYLFFLNPDTLLVGNPIDTLYQFLKNNTDVGVAALLLLDIHKNPYRLQGAQRLTPWRALFAFSFLNTALPKNPISQKYWILDWDKKTDKEVDTVPGTAFMIRRALFEKIGGFDERFFLFFEEEDLCIRVQKEGYRLFIVPKAKVIHYWGMSTAQIPYKEKEFLKSRFYFFKKHFGLFSALFVSFFLSIKKQQLLISTILIALFLSIIVLLNSYD